MSGAPAALLTLPCELRNAIYLFLFDDEAQGDALPTYAEPPNPLATALKLHRPHTASALPDDEVIPSRRLAPLLTCRQIAREASILALTRTAFHLHHTTCFPDCFRLRAEPLAAAGKLSAIRHITLTARIAQLRALTESWHGLPFAHPDLRLDSLVLVPQRPETFGGAYAEVADLSQSHTLAYILAESCKSLRHVGAVEVRNESCFNTLVWRLLYRSLVYRLWRWGGGEAGVRLECGADPDVQRRGWFRVYLGEKGAECSGFGSDVREEVVRLVGGNEAVAAVVLGGGGGAGAGP